MVVHTPHSTPDLENSLETSHFVLSTRINLIILLSCLDLESSWLSLLSGQESLPPGSEENPGHLSRIKSFPASDFICSPVSTLSFVKVFAKMLIDYSLYYCVVFGVLL